MTEAEIRKYDPEDDGLKAIMGEQFQGNSAGKFLDDSKEHKDCSGKTGKFSQPRSKAVDAEFAQANEDTAECKSEAWEAEHRPMKPIASLAECARSVGFGGLTALLYYWESIGLMAESIAVPSMILSAALFGLGVGKFIGGRK